jgi:filamentous hemagglutinin family protein
MKSFYHICRCTAHHRVVTAAMILFVGASAPANPIGLTVGSGTATISQSGQQLTINVSQNAFLNWNSFNIAAGETTIFNQPSASSIVWNRVNDPNPSQIFGNLQANGVVVLMNSSGFYFGPHSFVSAAGLVVSTANCVPPENGGGTWQFNGPPPLASIINYGNIKVGNGGQAFLIADQVENHGTIEAPGGSIGLAAGQTVLLCERPDGRGMSLQVKLPQGSVDNSGKLIADAGTIALNAKVINQDGLLQANSVINRNGVIELVASDALNLGANSQILARGDDSASVSSGGTVTLKSENNFNDNIGSRISVTGSTQGGNGGSVEVSAPNILSLDSSMDATAQSGWNGGTFFLDPVNLILGTSTANGVINVNTAFAGFSTIQLQATGNITINANTVWNLSDSTGISSGQLTLQAGGNIVFASTASQAGAIMDPNNWSVTLAAGYDVGHNAVSPGTGNIYLNGGSGLTGGGYVKTAAGDINLTAGQSILAGKGFVNTTGGGNITAHALAGDIGTGTLMQGYVYKSAGSPGQGYYVDSNLGLGGISTAAGGDVSLTAGRDVFSLLPKASGATYNGTTVATSGTDGTAGSGAYGNLPGQSGDVTIVAGRNVNGDYLVANGTGSIYAGVTMDANGNPVKDVSGNYVLGTIGSAGTTPSVPNLALNLVNGGWNVVAAQNIILQEVRNPNGVFNTFNGSAAYHGFNYAPDAYVNLTAGNLVQLGASTTALPRVDSLKVPAIYAPILDISAGSGGVVLAGDSTYNQLILYPSPEGSLIINTTQGGSLVGNLPSISGTPQIFSLIVSDSDRDQFNKAGQFGLTDHATTPVHLDNNTPIVLNISGDMSLVLLGAPEAAQINVGGNMNNSRFQGMNLSDSDMTSINVTGDIINRSAFTTVDLSQVSGAQAPDLSYLAQAQTTDPSATTLTASFYYNPTTHILTYQNISGKSLASVLTQLQNLPVQEYINGVPQWMDAEQTIPKVTTVSVFTPQTSAALLAQYNADNIANGLPAGGGPPSGTFGLVIGGGGKFNITARNMDLGTTAGIQSKGVSLYNVGGSYPLARLFETGSDISVNLAGDLNMYSTSIASLNGGDIAINAGGDVNAGSAEFTVNSIVARGIYTTSQGDVTVNARGNVNLNGSRIATYDGGNVSVESVNGNVDAGRGSSGYVIVQKYSVDPKTGVVTADTATIPGSGILATTFPDSLSTVGDILVQTPNGDIIANAGGIVQLPLNHVKNPTALVTLLAGYELQNGSPVIVSANRNIDVSGSGVISQNAILKATGNIKGVIFALGNLNLGATGIISVIALATHIEAGAGGGFGPGLLIGTASVNAQGADPSQIQSQDANGNGSTVAQGTAANAASAAASNENANQTAASTSDVKDNEPKGDQKPIALAQRVGRVTVLLPGKN